MKSITDESGAIVTHKEEHQLTGHRSAVLCMVLDQDAKRIFSGSLDGLIKVVYMY